MQKVDDGTRLVQLAVAGMCSAGRSLEVLTVGVDIGPAEAAQPNLEDDVHDQTGAWPAAKVPSSLGRWGYKEQIEEGPSLESMDAQAKSGAKEVVLAAFLVADIWLYVLRWSHAYSAVHRRQRQSIAGIRLCVRVSSHSYLAGHRR